MAEPDDWREDTRDETLDDHRPVRRPTSWPGRRVLVVPMDFSPTSRHALAWALEYAAAAPSEIHTLHVIDRRWTRSDLDADMTALRGELGDVHAAASAELAALFDDDARARIGTLHEHIATGSPVDEILSLARQVGAALIVIGSHGLGAVERFLVGSVAEKVVRGATCPVVVVKAPPDERADRAPR
jgi:nucleotide-binding universal stress UspA family protein